MATSSEFDMAAFKSYAYSYLAILPKWIEEDMASVASERVVRMEAMNLINQRNDLLEFFFAKDGFNISDANKMYSLYLSGHPAASNHEDASLISKLPSSFWEDLSYTVNHIWPKDGKYREHQGLFLEAMSSKDLRDLLTTGNSSRIYHCVKNSHVSYFLYYIIVKKGLISSESYLETFCSQGMLYSRDRVVKGELIEGIALHPQNFSSARTYINEENEPYRTIRTMVNELLNRYVKSEW